MASIRKREGRTGTTFQVIYRENGKQKTQGGFQTKRAAQQWAKATETDIARGTFIDPAKSREHFGPFAEKWMANQHHLKPKTHSDYEHVVQSRLIPELGSTQLGKLDHQRVQAFVNAQAAHYAPASVRKSHLVLRRILDAAVRQDVIAKNPAIGVSLPRTNAREMLFLTAEQADALAAAVPARYRALILCAAWTGLRAGELTALRVSDFADDELSAVRVTRAVSDVGGTLVEDTTKSERSRVVGVPATLRDELRAHLAAVHPHGHGPDALVFPGEHGDWHRHANFYRRHFAPAVRRALPADLHGLRFHDLRHTCAALMIDLGAHPKEIADRLGHSSISVTMDRYGHLFPDRHDALTNALDGALRAAR